MGALDTDSKLPADADDAHDAHVRRTNPRTNSVKSNKSIKSQGPEKFNSERSVEVSRLLTKDGERCDFFWGLTVICSVRNQLSISWS